MNGWTVPLIVGLGQFCTASVLLLIYGKSNADNSGFVAVMVTIYSNALLCFIMALSIHEIEASAQ